MFARTHTTLITLAAVLLTGCAGGPPERAAPAAASPVPREPAAAPAVSAGDGVAALALMLVGTPYRYGGDDPASGFDCSGLVHYTYAKHGIAVPRTSQQLYKSTRKIALDDAARGDLVFFQDQAKLSHVGIYVGDGRFVHAPASGRTVSVAHMSEPYYQRHLVAVGRVRTLARRID